MRSVRIPMFWFVFIRSKSIRGSVSVTDVWPNNSVGGLGLAYDNPSQARRSSHEARESPKLMAKLQVLKKGQEFSIWLNPSTSSTLDVDGPVDV